MAALDLREGAVAVASSERRHRLRGGVAAPVDLREGGRVDLPGLAAAAGAAFSPGALTGVHARNRLAQTSAGNAIPYDVLLVACGAGPTSAPKTAAPVLAT